jgi:succinate dehydrogenase / fumarate reductase cytochrome b subunit
MAEAPPVLRARPLSPHILQWRWHVTMATSILHRVTGVGLYFGLLIIVGWALALASGADIYATYTGLLGSLGGEVVLFGVTVCLFFHIANGLRHLVWDFGKGLSPQIANITAWIALAFAAVAAVGVWILAGLTGALGA